MASNTAQHPSHPLPAKHCLYVLYFNTGTGEGGELDREKVRGNTNITDCISSL